MNLHRPNRLALIASALLAATNAASGAPPDAPAPSSSAAFVRWTNPWRPRRVAEPNWSNTSRYADLLKAGQLYLTLHDAVAIAIENNLDVELQRYNLIAAQTDLLRARGGGTTRGLQYLINEVPIGIGGPASPLLASLGSQTGTGSMIPTNPSELGVLAGTQSNLSLLGQNTLSNGSPVPLYDLVLSANLSAAHTTTQETDPSSVDANALATNAINANAGLTQGFSSGATAALTFDNSRLTLNSPVYLYSPYVNSSLGVTVTQPLLRGFGRALNQRFIRIAKGEQKIAGLLFQQQLISTVFGVVRLYIDLSTMREDVTVKEESLALAEWLKREVTGRVEEGVLPPIELTRANAGVLSAKQDLINSSALLEEQEAIFKNVLFRKGLDDAALRDARIVPADALELPAETAEQSAGPLITQALTARPDVAQAGAQVDLTRIAMEGSRNNLKPELDLTAFAENTGLAGAMNPLSTDPAGAFTGGYGTALGQIFRRDYPIYGAGIQLTLPLHNRAAQADAARDEVVLHQSEIHFEQFRNQARLEVEDALIAMRRAKASYEAAVEAAKLQAESLDAEKARFEEGLSTALLVGDTQSVYSQAKLSELAARGSFAKARATLLRATGAILEAYGFNPAAIEQSQAVR